MTSYGGPRGLAGGKAPEIDDVDLDRVLAMARRKSPTSGLDAVARERLSMVLRMVPHILHAKRRRRPQGVRNDDLEAVAKHARQLRAAYERLDAASKAALHLAGMNETMRPTVLRSYNEEGDEEFSFPSRRLSRPWLEGLAASLEQLANCAQKAVMPSKRGAPVDEGTLEAVERLARFVDWCRRVPENASDEAGREVAGDWIKVSGKDQGPFHRFVQAAFQLATGMEEGALGSYDLLGAVRRVAKQRGAEIGKSAPIPPHDAR